MSRVKKTWIRCSPRHFSGADECATRISQPHRQTEPLYQLVGLLPSGGLDRYDLAVDVADSLPIAREPSQAEANQYLIGLCLILRRNMFPTAYAPVSRKALQRIPSFELMTCQEPFGRI